MNFAKKMPTLTACLVALLFGGIGVFAYSPFDIWEISFLSTAALVWLVSIPQKKSALCGVFIWAVSYFAVGVNWVHVSMIQFGGVPEIISYLAVLLLAAYLALYPLLFAFVSRTLRLNSPWQLAAIWSGTEYLRGVVFTGFPWLQFGYSLIDSPFAGIAPIVGVEGLNFFVMLVSAQAVQIVQDFAKKSLKPTAYLSFCIMLMLTFASQFISWIAINKEVKPTSFSLVQANIAQRVKWDPSHFHHTLQTYQSLVGEALGKSEVIILPESAMPATERQIAPLLHQLDHATRTAGSELLIGTLYQSPKGVFNSAVALGGKEPYTIENAERFNKHHLVPFGEYVPFGNLLDWMRDIFVLPVNLSQGEFIQPPLTLANKRFNIAICYEIIFGHQVQQNLLAHNADYLLTISNDAWFGESIGPWQHVQIARMRALELGKPLIRATNTGITVFVDPYGKIVHQAEPFTSTLLNHSMPVYLGETPFSRIGHWGIYLFSILLILAGLMRKPSSSNKHN